MERIQLKGINIIGVVLILTLFINCSQKKQPESLVNQTAVIKVEAEPDTILYEFASIEDGTALFKKLNYTPESWQAGIREIPNVQIVDIPERWRGSTSQHIEVKLKKQVFFRILAPLILSVNGDIMKDRNRIDALRKKSLSEMNDVDKEWIKNISVRYKLIKPEDELTSDVLSELWLHVDIIPPSLAMSQSAEESGWGTSRFAAEGNALFGQWAWGENAMKPKEQRSGMGDYGLARFDSPLESMRAYMLNLNTHNAYKELRAKRAQLRESGQEISGAELAKTLTKYSERGEEYVNTLLSIMRVNSLAQTDDAYLKESPVIIFTPVD